MMRIFHKKALNMNFEKKIIPIIFAAMLIVFIILPLSGCSCSGSQSSSVKNPSSASVSPAAKNSSAAPASSAPGKSLDVTVKNSSGSLSISAPSGWKSDKLWPDSEISISSMGYYIVVLKKTKSDYAAGYTANDLLTSVVKDPYLNKAVNNMNLKPSSNITINGLRGVTAQMNAHWLNGGFLAYLISVVEDNNNFYEIIGWTSSDSGSMDLNYLQSVMNNFKVN
jgi:hypothetical protein